MKMARYVLILSMIFLVFSSFFLKPALAQTSAIDTYQQRVEAFSKSDINFSQNPIKTVHHFVLIAASYGVPVKTLLFLLLLPLIALIIVFFRQVIGIKTMGIYIPLILTIVFLETKLLYGIILFLSVVLIGTLFRFLLNKVRLLYIPKMAILLTLVSLSTIFVLTIAAMFGASQIAAVSVLAIFVIIVLLEEFIDIQVKQGFKKSLTLVLGTVLISILSYFVVSWQPLQLFFLSYPEIIFLIVLADFILGQWSGLRLTEYWRFRKGVGSDDTSK